MKTAILGFLVSLTPALSWIVWLAYPFLWLYYFCYFLVT